MARVARVDLLTVTKNRIQGLCRLSACALLGLAFAACGGGGGSSGSNTPSPPPPPPAPTLDDRLRAIISAEGLTGDPSLRRDLPSIDDPLPQLGKLLFFSKSLSGEIDTACASCHHPALGGGDALALPVGTGAVDPDVVGPGRRRPDGLPNVGRHSQSVFNVGLFDAGLFWDSRIESINKDAGRNGAGSGIRTPDTELNVADPMVPVGMTLPAAQARFPVTVPSEMRGNFLPGENNETVRQHLAARIGDYGVGQGELATNNWLAQFQQAFTSGEPAEDLITFNNIALAIAEYQRSMVFVDTPWKAYVEGDDNAISTQAKEGAILFFNGPEEGGMDCARCHSGDFFTDEEHRTVSFPQLGPGKSDGPDGNADFGREQHTQNSADRFRFRTPTMLNLRATAPYTHSGVYDSTFMSAGHYALPEDIFSDFLAAGGVCSIAQFAAHPDCDTLFPDLVDLSEEALAKVFNERLTDPDSTFADLDENLLPANAPDLMEAFIDALTDPCTLDRACLAPWIPEPDEAPDENQLNAVDADGNAL